MPRRISYYIERAAAITAAVILLQTLYYKFTGHEESIYIFSSIGLEPYGRIGIGIIELVIALLVLYPKTAPYGGLMGMGVMMGAVATHVFILGIEIRNDGGTLFYLGITTLICCAIVLFIRREDFHPIVLRRRSYR